MKKIHISYSTKDWFKSLDLLEQTAYDIGKVDVFIPYIPDDLHIDNFWQENLHILSNPIGAGFWIWKPYIILMTLKLADDGDIVLYTDAGMKVIDCLDPLFEIVQTSKDNRMLFEPSRIYGPHLHSMWTKRDCFILMGCDEPYYWNSRMLHAAFSVWMKTEKNVEFISEWLRYVKDRRIITNEPNTCGLPNLPDFAEHRYDQAVLSLLSLKHGRELYREPTQFSNNETFANSPYKQLFDHHSGKI